MLLASSSIEVYRRLMSKVLDDRALANDALAALRRRPSRFTLPDGTSVRIPKATIDGLIELLTAQAEGDEATVVRSPRELTTQQAAKVLNVSSVRWRV